MVMRSSVDGVKRALLALQTSGAPPTATGFFISHHRAEGEQQADALGDDLILSSEQACTAFTVRSLFSESGWLHISGGRLC